MKCEICQKTITATAAFASHMRKHVKDGSVKEEKDPKTGKLKWIPTGKKPNEHKEVKFCNPRIRSLITASRKPITALLKKDKIYIKCRKCGKASLSKPSSIDDRFISTNCCDTVTLFQTRFIDKVKEQKQFTA